MTSFIRYPLPIKKSEINWDLEYMKKGGSQLIEILEKDIPMADVLSDPKKFKITEGQAEKLRVWIKHNTIAGATSKELGLYGSYSVRKSLFLEGGGVFKKLVQVIPLMPHIDPHGNIQSRYSFLVYDAYQEKEGMIMKCGLTDQFKDFLTREKREKRFDTFLFAKKELGKWQEAPLLNFEKKEWIQKYNDFK